MKLYTIVYKRHENSESKTMTVGARSIEKAIEVARKHANKLFYKGVTIFIVGVTHTATLDAVAK